MDAFEGLSHEHAVFLAHTFLEINCNKINQRQGLKIIKLKIEKKIITIRSLLK